ncbi:MAG: hypothetical protein QOE53_2708 [Pseudonocardiales bacterium]|nr:hypothetical protein [Pseudonocardiales bacterium]
MALVTTGPPDAKDLSADMRTGHSVRRQATAEHEMHGCCGFPWQSADRRRGQL